MLVAVAVAVAVAVGVGVLQSGADESHPVKKGRIASNNIIPISLFMLLFSS